MYFKIFFRLILLIFFLLGIYFDKQQETAKVKKNQHQTSETFVF